MQNAFVTVNGANRNHEKLDILSNSSGAVYNRAKMC